MKSKALTSIVAIPLFAALAVPIQMAAQNPTRYTLTDIGTIGGSFSQANSLNSRGSAAGFSTPTGDQVIHASLWQKGMMVDLGTLGGPNSAAPEDSALNDSDEFVGFSDTSTSDPNGEDFCFFGTQLICLPFVWEKGVQTPLPTLGGNNAQAIAINNRGQIVGVSETTNLDPCSPDFLQIEAAMWYKGQIEVLRPLPGDPVGFANGINDRGQAVGVTGCVTGNLHAVLWTNGVPIDLGNLGGVSGNIAFAINNKGQVAGQSDLPGDTTHHAFLWDGGVMSDLGTILSLPVSLANAINNRGQVVGFSQDLNGDFSSTVAWVWQDGMMTDLNDVIPPDSPWFLIEALGINNRGEIAGYALNTLTGDVHGYVLTPIQGSSENSASTGQNRASGRLPIVLPENVRQILKRQIRSRYHGLGGPSTK